MSFLSDVAIICKREDFKEIYSIVDDAFYGTLDIEIDYDHDDEVVLFIQQVKFYSRFKWVEKLFELGKVGKLAMALYHEDGTEEAVFQAEFAEQTDGIWFDV